MADIFISYVREDVTVAQKLAAALENHQWSVFWDRHIPSGKRFETVISEQLSSSWCVIVLWSKASIMSDYVKDEARDAYDRNLLMPALIESVQPPFGFRQIHDADLISWKGSESHLGLVGFIKDISNLFAVSMPHNAPNGEMPYGGHLSPRSFYLSRCQLVAGTATIRVGGAGLIMWMMLTAE
jgi:hypothetical protein